MPDHVERPGLPGCEIVKRIEKALEIDGTHTWEDMRELLIEGRVQIFYNDHGAWITEILVTPRKRLLNVWLVAGELPEVMELQREVERYALTNTCDEIIVRGVRAEWFGDKNVARQYGWEEYAVVLRKLVTEEMNREKGPW